jgi:hypothetical protein
VTARVARRSAAQAQGLSNSIAGYIPLFCGNASPRNPALPAEQARELSKDLPHDWKEQRRFLGFADGRSIISGQNAR